MNWFLTDDRGIIVRSLISWQWRPINDLIYCENCRERIQQQQAADPQLVMSVQYGVQYTEWYEPLASQQTRWGHTPLSSLYRGSMSAGTRTLYFVLSGLAMTLASIWQYWLEYAVCVSVNLLFVYNLTFSGTSNDSWTGGSIVSQLNPDILEKIKNCFQVRLVPVLPDCVLT